MIRSLKKAHRLSSVSYLDSPTAFSFYALSFTYIVHIGILTFKPLSTEHYISAFVNFLILLINGFLLATDKRVIKSVRYNKQARFLYFSTAAIWLSAGAIFTENYFLMAVTVTVIFYLIVEAVRLLLSFFYYWGIALFFPYEYKEKSDDMIRSGQELSMFLTAPEQKGLAFIRLVHGILYIVAIFVLFIIVSITMPIPDESLFSLFDQGRKLATEAEITKPSNVFIFGALFLSVLAFTVPKVKQLEQLALERKAAIQKSHAV
ncbi:hypothetical protein [Priestia filamentosa]|uniref:Uncharacterized protein n=1 Tax=Priestia filamentosa TaxID=1402861 RepID=A0A1X7F7Z3_9BACI|nr:hypothetical protein [Priestia filamentosa]AKO91793.1 hypothetical protein BEH_06550 [Priestia filamentosa]MDT3761935.1 hypothetical protein [Priestia filamentosa]OXS68019.1 hypothetical protein B1B01_15715 [Priestia filamentosa]RJS64781.1 hypothetical protein CJ485_08450 [Priestia filamentosa]WCM17023.1 hypothetical protein PGN40_06655 [Priestia filamentosa]